MSKKAPVHNYITNQYSIEIDYEKLADAIIKVQSANTQTQKSESLTKEKSLRGKIMLFLQLMMLPETLKKRKDLSGTIMLFSSFASSALEGIGIILTILSGTMFYTFFKYNIFNMLGRYVFSYSIGMIFSYMFGILFRLSAQEISNTEDLTVVSMAFTSMVSFIAMVAAVAAVVVSLKLEGVI